MLCLPILLLTTNLADSKLEKVATGLISYVTLAICHRYGFKVLGYNYSGKYPGVLKLVTVFQEGHRVKWSSRYIGDLVQKRWVD